MPANWETKIETMRVWKRGNEVAVHKPLLVLMILAKAQRGGANVFFFKDLLDPLEKALRDFGPGRDAIHPEYPFWHLQRDGFWVVDDSEQFVLSRGAAGPTKGALLEANAIARVPAEMWEELCHDPSLVSRLLHQVLAAFWPGKSSHKDIIDALGLEFHGA
jgi:predicted restriction endonuclease